MNIEIIIAKKNFKYKGPKSWEETEPWLYAKIFEVGKMLAEKPHALFALPQAIFQIPTNVLQFLFDKNAMRTVGVKDEEEQEKVMGQGYALLKIAQSFTNSEAPHSWKVPKIKAAFLGHNYYGPGDSLGMLTFEEFWFAEAAYERNDMDGLIAVLYRRDPFRKQAYSEELNQKTLNDLKSLPELTKEMIVFNYQGCRLGFSKKFKHVFPTKKIEQENDAAPKKAPKKGGGWLQVAIGMAGDSSVEFDSLRKLNVIVALQMVENKLVKVKQLKRKTK
ncbi:hypothetical protein [Runella sp. SP2]|uniref:hypothetical protein n=1 Tax=Runella sp. SP2 TaxID=2268026 RepID=UPI000F084D70|nr:hypothetical protein [Runella sp. SP2]AYQ31443.1 hypothetical protein DTQ70_04265 [Runella sp. SP2]